MRRERSPRLLVVDLMGTTVAEDGSVEAALRAALADAGRPVGDGRLRAVRGLSKREALGRLLDVDREAVAAVRAYDIFRRALENGYRRQAPVAVAGASAMLRSLRATGIAVALTTGLERSITDTVLSFVPGITANIDTVVCGDEVALGRPAPYMIFRAMERCSVLAVGDVAVVGDTAADLQAGTNAGVRWNVGVLDGAGTPEALAAQPHTALVGSVTDVPSLWR